METIVFIIMLIIMLTGLLYLCHIFHEQFSALRKARRRRAQIVQELEKGCFRR